MRNVEEHEAPFVITARARVCVCAGETWLQSVRNLERSSKTNSMKKCNNYLHNL